MRNGLLDGEVALLCPSQKMRKEMDGAWKDFFDRNEPLQTPPCLPRLNGVGGEFQKNPDNKQEDVWRWVEGNLFTFLGK